MDLFMTSPTDLEAEVIAAQFGDSFSTREVDSYFEYKSILTQIDNCRCQTECGPQAVMSNVDLKLPQNMKWIADGVIGRHKTK
jgi:hypothetical protein